MQKHNLHWRRSLGWVEKWERRRRLGKWQPRRLQDDRGDSGCGSLSSLTYMGICLRSKWPREVCDFLMASNDLTVNPGSVGCPAYDILETIRMSQKRVRSTHDMPSSKSTSCQRTWSQSHINGRPPLLGQRGMVVMNGHMVCGQDGSNQVNDVPLIHLRHRAGCRRRR